MDRKLERSLNRTLLAGCAALCLGGAALAAPAQRLHFDLPAEPLGTSINRVAQQAQEGVVFDADLVRGRRAPALRGDFDVEGALQRLLAGSGLRVRRAPSGAFVVEREDPPEQPHPGASTPNDELIVTASKRPERLHDAPVAVSALTSTSLQLQGATRLQDYIRRVPGLNLMDTSSINAGEQLSIRGVTTGSGGGPTVGIYVDEFAYGASTVIGSGFVPDIDPMDLARIEVLRGPQGTLYGAGSLGGLFKYVTAAPDPSHAFGRMEVDGSHVDGGGSGYGLRVAANTPLTDDLALRVSAYDRLDPGFVDDPSQGRRNVNTVRAYGGRAALAWTPNARWTVKASALVQKQVADGSASVDYDPTTLKPLYGDLQQVRIPGSGRHPMFDGMYALEVDGDLGWASLVSATSYNHQSISINLGDPGYPDVSVDRISTNKFTQELRLQSPGDRKLAWRAGLFYTYEDSPLDFKDYTVDPVSGADLGEPLLLYITEKWRYQEIAGFGDVTYHFTPRFEVTAGLRYSYHLQHQGEYLSGVWIGDPYSIQGDSTDHALTYLVNPKLKLSDDTTLYARLATGYRPGGPNPAAGTTPPAYGPDTVTNYEIGLKQYLFDTRLSLDLSAYYIQWKDIQLSAIGVLDLTYTQNAGKASVKGVEATAVWRPLPGLEIDGNVSHIIPELSEDLPAGGLLGLKGDTLPGTPRWSGQVDADYDVALAGAWRGFAGASYRYVGRVYGDFQYDGVTRFVHPSYDVVDLRAGVRTSDWTVTAYARNVGDSRGQTFAAYYYPIYLVSVIQPRTFGLSIARTF